MFIIAEAGLNYSGYLPVAKNYAQFAKVAGCEAVKFQITDVEKTWSKNNEKYSELAGDIKNKIKACEMSFDEWTALKHYCDEIDIEFIATPSTKEIVDFLASIGVSKIKIGSDRACEKDLVQHAINTGLTVMVSNGFFDVSDYKNIIRFYCVSKYPTDWSDINENELTSGYYQGFSDHTLETGAYYPELIAGSSIKYWEKHFKLFDHCIDEKASLAPKDFLEFVTNVRRYCK